MTSKENRKRIKQIQKKIDQLDKELQKMEIRPCQGDAELAEDIPPQMISVLEWENK